MLVGSIIVETYLPISKLIYTGNVGEFPTYSNWDNPGTNLGQTWV